MEDGIIIKLAKNKIVESGNGAAQTTKSEKFHKTDQTIKEELDFIVVKFV